MTVFTSQAEQIDKKLPTAKKPNIIIIMVDDMGYGGVSCFDNKNFKTPEIDRLCKDGMKLTSFYSNGAVCSPTRAALMTGRYQQRSGCDLVVNADPSNPMHHVGIHDKEWTFAEAMKSAGYKTGLMGKWHLGYKPEYNPLKHGFDQFNGFISGNIDAHSHLNRKNEQDWWQGEELKDQPGYHTDIINDEAINFIEKNKDEPFFLYIAHGSPHSPHQARASAFERGPNKGEIPSWSPNESYSNNKAKEDWLIRHFILPVDEGVGQIRKKLDELEITKNTMIWFISDNGGTKKNYTMSSKTRSGKASFYEGGIRVPGIIWAPGRVPAGSQSDEAILSFDIMPTTMKISGITAPDNLKLDGRDVTPAVFENKQLESVVHFWNMKGVGGALRDGVWKIVINEEKDDVQLYNLELDSREKKDLTLEFPKRVKNMSSIYHEMIKETAADSPYGLME